MNICTEGNARWLQCREPVPGPSQVGMGIAGPQLRAGVSIYIYAFWKACHHASKITKNIFYTIWLIGGQNSALKLVKFGIKGRPSTSMFQKGCRRPVGVLRVAYQNNIGKDKKRICPYAWGVSERSIDHIKVNPGKAKGMCFLPREWWLGPLSRKSQVWNSGSRVSHPGTCWFQEELLKVRGYLGGSLGSAPSYLFWLRTWSQVQAPG